MSLLDLWNPPSVEVRNARRVQGIGFVDTKLSKAKTWEEYRSVLQSVIERGNRNKRNERNRRRAAKHRQEVKEILDSISFERKKDDR